MRHATDPDHVIAVTTIVGNQRNSLRAVLIGAFWGGGHTVTIFVVGAVIILFNPSFRCGSASAWSCPSQ
jgi:high-affinity nickel permease